MDISGTDKKNVNTDVKFHCFSVDKASKNEALTSSTKNWTPVYNFKGTHFQNDQNISKQNYSNNKTFLTKKTNTNSPRLTNSNFKLQLDMTG